MMVFAGEGVRVCGEKAESRKLKVEIPFGKLRAGVEFGQRVGGKVAGLQGE